ncbi:MAG: hypothetical protein OXJ53_00615 [Gammaproteobacteria bacterium]|nr:hypothetical protein [Gammaproteobacteria bacterium]
MPSQVDRLIKEYCKQPDNRDGRGLRSGTVAEIRKTLRHLKSAVKKVNAGGTPEARYAMKLLKRAHHMRDFKVLAAEARGYAGKVQRLGKKRAKQTAMCEAASVPLGQTDALGQVHLERVVSVAEMESIGRHLHLCVAHNDQFGREYHRRLRRNTAEFWQLRAGAALALLEVTRDDEGLGWIAEFEAKKSGVRLPRSMLLRIVRELKASGDRVDEFHRAGAFWAFRRPQPPTAEIQVGPAIYRVWRFPDELIILGKTEGRRGRLSAWSRFVREPVRPWYSRTRGRLIRARGQANVAGGAPVGNWAWSSTCGGKRSLSDQQLQALMLASPEMYAVLAG